MKRHRVPGYDHALWMRAAARAMERGEPLPSVDVSTEELEAAEGAQISNFDPPSSGRHRSYHAAVTAIRTGSAR